MAQKSLFKHLTFEDKFSRKYRVNSQAKRNWTRYMKQHNNKALRREFKYEDRSCADSSDG